MKVQNAVIGMEVQVKRDCRGHFDELIKEGLVCTVDRIDDSYMADYELRLVNPNIDDGYAWVNASDVRKYIKPTVVPEPVVEPDDIVKLREDCTAKHGEFIPQGLYIVGHVDGSDNTCTVLTVHGGYGQASLPMAMVHKVGVCSTTNG